MLNLEDIKLSSAQWEPVYKYFTSIEVLDPDGWDRKIFEISWNEEITLEEFEKRVSYSTIRADMLLKFFQSEESVSSIGEPIWKVSNKV